MDERSLAELAQSIRSQDCCNQSWCGPSTAATSSLPASGGGVPRRWRGSSRSPPIVREVPDEAALVMALIENVQREDLNPIEEAAAVQRLIDEFKMTHEQAADAVGRSRSATSNLLRLLKLAKPVQEMLMRGALEMGHARALLAP